MRAARQRQRLQQPVSSRGTVVMVTEPIKMNSRSLRMLLKKQKRGQKLKIKAKKLLRAYMQKSKKRKRQSYSRVSLMQMRCMIQGWILQTRF